MGQSIVRTELLDLFRLLPEEREFLLGEIVSGTAMELQSPSQTTKPDVENVYIDYISSRTSRLEPILPSMLSTTTPREDTSLHEGFAEQNSHNTGNYPETEINKEEYRAYGAGFEYFCDLWERELGLKGKKSFQRLDNMYLRRVEESKEEEILSAENVHQLTFESDRDDPDAPRRI